MSTANTLKDEDIDKLVLNYLKKRKFTEAGKVLELEIRESRAEVEAQTMALQHWLDADSGMIEHLAFDAGADGDPAAYLQSFERLAAWVDGSLDMYKPELERLLYPVFIQSFLTLMASGAAAEARDLLAQHGQRFLEDATGAASRARAQELRDLQGAASPEALAANPTAQALRQRKHRVRLCSYAYSLLMRFLQGAQLLLLLGLLNEHVTLQVYEGPPDPAAAAAAAAEDYGGGAGVLPADVVAINQQGLGLQLLAGGVEDSYAAQQAEREEQEAQQRAEEAATTKKERERLRKAAAAAKSKREAVGLDRMEPQIPLPELTEQRRAALMAELEHRAAVSAQALPSAAFFTFINTHQSLNTVAFTSDASMVAAGFADSSVRLYRMSKQHGGRGTTGDARAADSVASRAVNGGAAGGGSGGSNATSLCGHSGPVYAADFSPDDSLLLTSSADGTVRLWSVELLAGLAAYRGHMLPVWDVAACPTFGYYFATAGADRTARLWSTERSQALRIFVGHGADVDVVRWHPNCHYLATGSSDRSVRLWDVRTGRCCRVLTGHRAPLTSLAFSPDGAMLCSGDAHGTIRAWDLAAAKQVAALSDHSRAVWALAFSQGDRSLLASGGADCTVRLWDANALGSVAADAGAAAAQQVAEVADGGQGGGSGTAALVKTYRTKATPVFAARFSARNLLLCGGALTLYRPQKLYS